MIDLEIITEMLKKMMKKHRLQHVYRVSQLAKEIAVYHKIPFNKIEASALIHDCVKDYSLDDLEYLIEKYNIELTDIEKQIPSIWHAYVGAEVARNIFNIEDIEILEAIKYHSTASSSFGVTGKIVYIADKIEPNRKSLDLSKSRTLVWKNIDLAMLEILNNEIRFLFSREKIIHPYTLEARNKILIDRGTRNSGKD